MNRPTIQKSLHSDNAISPSAVPANPYYHLPPSPETLTAREKDVLKLIVDEYTSKEIAERLFISKRTVESHRRNLAEKIGSRNAIGLAKYAIKHSLTSAP